MGKCCAFDWASFRKDADCSVKEIDKGIQIEVKVKDDAKAESLKKMLKAVCEFFDCKC